MAVQSDTSRISYAGNNSTSTSYAVPFVFLENTHLKAIAKTSAGVETVVTLTNHTGAGNVNGGTVRTAVAIPATNTLTIYRDVPITQTTTYAEGGDFPAASHERALDKLTTITQQLDRRINTCVRGSEATPLSPLPSPTGTQQFVLATTFNQPPAWQPQSAIAIGPVIATGSSEPRFVSDRFNDSLSAKDFGVTGNGTTDDTLALLAAMAYCRANDKVLLIDGNVVFNFSTVPSGSLIVGQYVNGCSMRGTNNARITITGKVGFEMTGVTETYIGNLRVVTNGQEMTESDAGSASPIVFRTAGGSKNNAVYENLVITHNVTNTTGAYRGAVCIQEDNVSVSSFRNITVANAVGSVWVYNSGNVRVDNVYATNIETNVLLDSVTDYEVSFCSHINTKQQANFWVGRTRSPSPRLLNGMDNVLVDNGGGNDPMVSNRGIITGLKTEWAHERAVYAISSNVSVSNCQTLNSDGIKVVGNNYNAPAKNISVTNCHLLVDDDWQDAYPATPNSRPHGYLFTTYNATNISVDSCSIVNTRFAEVFPRCLVLLSNFTGFTVEDVQIRNCSAVHVETLVLVNMCERTSAEVAALTPAGSLLVARGVVITGCYYKSNTTRAAGALYAHRSNDASTDAKENYATENITLTNNTLVLNPTAANSDDWFFDVRFMDGVYCANNSPDKPFNGGSLFSYSTTANNQPTPRNIYMHELNLKHSVGIQSIIAGVNNWDALRGSKLSFRGVSSSIAALDNFCSLTTINTKDGKPYDGIVIAEFAGEGVDQTLNTTDSWAVEMVAGGDFYFGKVLNGTTLVNQSGRVLSGSATFNPSNLVDGAGETTTVTVTGAALGDYAEVSFSLDVEGITVTAWVSAADTVSVRLQNESGGTLDLGSGTLRARVFKTAPPVDLQFPSTPTRIVIRGSQSANVFYRVKMTKIQ